LAASLVLFLLASTASAAPKPGERTPDQVRYRVDAAGETPYVTFRVHRVGNLGLNISNTGYLGDRKDFCTGLPVPSLEFPINSGVEYNYAGGIWVGAVRHGDTVVSLAITGGSGVGSEFWPRKFPEGDILERTTRPILRQPANSRCQDVKFSNDAVSEQDFVAVYCDTLGEDLGLGGEETRPLGVQVTQKSYSWSTEYARNFVLMEMTLENVGEDTLYDLYMGIFMDQDVFGPGGTYDDDVTGFTHSVPSPVGHGFLDTVNLAWIADNDGDPRGLGYESWNASGVTGLRVVQAPGNVQFSFNWWISNSSTARDWGPNKRDTKVVFKDGNLGTPGSDIEHYAIMSNGEFDYPQWEAAIDHSLEGWLPPPPNPALAADLANGFDTRYLLSFGPFDLRPDSVLPLTFAVIAGESFHVDAQNYVRYFDAGDPAPWLANLNLDDFALNSLWAGWVYDSPGYDTDGDGVRGKYRIVDGDTAFYTGDGVPDYQGPPAPPPPSELKYSTEAGKITIRWNGHESETRKDPFSFIPDFEGYRVYMSRTLLSADFALIASRDNINYVRRKFQPASGRWQILNPPFTLDSLKTLYDDLSDTTRGFPFHPDSYSVCTEPLALQEIVLDSVDASKLDTNLYCFGPFEANDKVNDTTTAYEVDSLGHELVRVIRKVYPYARPEDSVIWLTDGTPVEWPYYEYEFAIDGLQLAEPIFLAVTTFDFGSPAAELSPLESSPLANATEIWPINSASVVESERPTPGVYPNPYRLADDYNLNRWENPRRLEDDAERARKVTFTNVPDTCSISIWSLDGDLVRQLEHAAPSGSSDATVVVWNLITRNTQAAKTGVYIYTIESRFGTDIGKLVIIK